MAARFGAVLLAGFVGFGAVTWFALESREVAVLRTPGTSGAFHETRVWLAEADGAIWIEAATPERDWYQRLLQHPTVRLARDGRERAYRAVPVPGPEGHARIRSLLRARYGWADRWVGLFQDTRASVAVRLETAGDQVE